MTEDYTPSYEGFDNFNVDKEAHSLPFKDAPELKGNRNVNNGSYFSVVRIDNDRVLKIMRAGKFDSEGKVDRRFDPSLEPLADKSRGETAVDTLQQFAKEKSAADELLEKYLHNHLPKKYGTIISDSPRRDIEENRLFKSPNILSVETNADGSDLNPSLSKIPNSETALMEVWENVDKKNQMLHKSFEELKDLKKDEKFLREQKDMANSLLDLFAEKRIMVDVVDGNGIPVKLESGSPASLVTASHMLTYLEGTYPLEIYLRNMAYKDGKLMLIDTYPVDDKAEILTTDDIDEIADVVKDEAKLKDYLNDLHQFSKNNPDEKMSNYDSCKFQTLQYFMVLKEMGADFE